MRIAISLIFFALLFRLSAEQFVVFEKGGLYGLKSEEGTIAIPAVHEEIGWSDGSKEVVQGVIGIRNNTRWGLISTRNKPLSEIVYHSIIPINDQNFKASVKGKFSNQLFYGVLDKSGKVLVGFNYFSIEELDNDYLVSKYDSRTIKYGLISRDEEVRIPLKYRSIDRSMNFYLGRTGSNEIDIYVKGKGQLEINIDSIQHTSKGIICFRQGFVGFIDESGEMTEAIRHKKIEVTEGIVLTYPFPHWEAIENNQQVKLSIMADSLLLVDSLWVAFNNGAHHFALSDSIFRNSSFEIKSIHKDHLVVENGHTEEWSVISKGGQQLITGYDSIFGNDEVFWARSQGVWKLLGRYGKRKNKLNIGDLKAGNGGQFLCKTGGYWGVIDHFGLAVTSFKFEAIVPVEGRYHVRYLNRWGIMDGRGRWILRPEFSEVFSFGPFSVGRKSFAYTYALGTKQWRSTSKPLELLSDNYLLIVGENGGKGVVDRNLDLVIPTSFSNIRIVEDYAVLYADSICSILKFAQRPVADWEERIQDIGGVGENYILIKKDGKWGFLDDQGRMRVSNRYEDARVFNEGLAPVKLRGKWGFIDKAEKLVIQPFYDEVAPFNNGLSVVEIKGRKGLINKKGEEVVSLLWSDLVPTKHGNFIARSEDNKYGLIAGTGSFLLRTDYDFLEDKGNRVIVSKYGKKGMLEYSGKEIFQIIYDDLKISGDFVLLKH